MIPYVVLWVRSVWWEGWFQHLTMLRSVVTKGVGVGAAVAAAGPSTSQCRAQPAFKPSVAGNPGKVRFEAKPG